MLAVSFLSSIFCNLADVNGPLLRSKISRNHEPQFCPFTPSEQAVVAHCSLLSELQKLRQPINIAEDKLMGDLHVSMLDDS